MFLTSPSRSLRINSNATATTTEPIVAVGYVDTSASQFLPGEQLSQLAGTTVVKVLNEPSTGLKRQIKSISVYNGDSVSHQISVFLYDDTTPYQLGKYTIPSGKTLLYTYENAWVIQGGDTSGVTSFTGLDDVPGTYSGASSKLAKVNGTEDALEFDFAAFTELSDAPSSYTGHAGEAVVVNGTEDGVTFSAAGGGGSGSYFSGFSTTGVWAANTITSATKGGVFIPEVDMEITHLHFSVDQASASDSYYGIIAELSGATVSDLEATSAGTVNTVLGTTTSISSGSTDGRRVRADFASPISLTAGTKYLLGVVFDQGSGTAAARLLTMSNASAGSSSVNCPGTLYHGIFYYSTVGLSASQAPSSSSAGILSSVVPEGFATF